MNVDPINIEIAQLAVCECRAWQVFASDESDES